MSRLELKSCLGQSAGKLDYRIYSDLAQIAEVRDQWTDLLAGSAYNQAFGSIEWYLASLRAQPFLRPYLVVATHGSQVASIFPLALNPDTGVIAFPHLENDYNDMLVRGNNPAYTASLMRHVLSGGSCSPQIALSKLRPDSQCVRAATSLNGNLNFECHSRDVKIYHYLELPGTFDDYLASRGKLFRKSVRRALRIENRPGFAIRELHPDEFNPFDLPKMFIKFNLIRHDERCAFRSEHTQSFTKQLLPALFRDRRLRAFAMFVDDRMIAIDLYLVISNGLLAWNGGFLAERECRAPGTTLIAFAVRQAIAEKLREVDFGEGDDAYKKHWTNNSYWVRELRLVGAVSQQRSAENQG